MIKNFATTFLAVLLVTGCASSSKPTPSPQYKPPVRAKLNPVYKQVQIPQTEHLIDRIELGMNREQVRKIMGKPDKIDLCGYSNCDNRTDTWTYNTIKCFAPDTRPSVRTTYSGSCSIEVNHATQKVVAWDKERSKAIVMQRQCVANCP